MDLSSVSTAPSVASLKTNKDDGDVEAARQSSEEIEIASIVAVAQKHANVQKTAVLPNSPIAANDADVGYDDYDDDDDLIPPPPPESPQHDDVEEELHTQPVDENDVDFPNTVDNDDDHDIDDDDNDDDDGAGFEINNNDHDKDDEPDASNDTLEEKRRRKEKRMEKLALKKRSQSYKKDNKKSKQASHLDSDGEEVVKPKSKTKKKINPYSTHFSPKGVPGPRTYTQIPLSDLKPDTPEDTHIRRSKRVRMPPLEYWRGEKPIFGGNDFGDEFDGVKNMPVVVGIAKPDPTPYKKRKVVPAVSDPKKKKSEDKRRGYDDNDGPAMIAIDEPFDSTSLRQKLPVNDGKVAHLWDERYQEARGISTFHAIGCCFVVCETLKPSVLCCF
jgi:centromere protein C